MKYITRHTLNQFQIVFEEWGCKIKTDIWTAPIFSKIPPVVFISGRSELHVEKCHRHKKKRRCQKSSGGSKRYQVIIKLPNNKAIISSLN